ncbi:MAG: hypothetical protein AAFX85_03450 [Pseudomonadota bacterium]
MADPRPTADGGRERDDAPRPRRVPAYFTLYLLSELLSSLRQRARGDD